jgi:hypothetical protein
MQSTPPAASPESAAGQTAQKKWPSAPPRPGAIKVFETDQLIIWDDRQETEDFLHKHARDFIALTIEEGPSRTIDENGKVSGGGGSKNPWPKGNGEYAVAAHIVKAGTGPHSEKALDPNKRRRQFWIELKGTEPKDCRNWSTDPVCNK